MVEMRGAMLALSHLELCQHAGIDNLIMIYFAWLAYYELYITWVIMDYKTGERRMNDEL